MNAFKQIVRFSARRAFAGVPMDSAVAVDLLFVMPRPGSITWKTKPMPRRPHVAKPDIDNLAKSFLDACNGLLWTDDAKISDMRLRKVIAAGQELPHIEAIVRRADA